MSTMTRTIQQTLRPHSVSAAVAKRSAPRARPSAISEGGELTEHVATAVRVALMIGNNAAAHALGVSNSQPSRWATGAEEPSPESATRVVAFANVVAQIRFQWSEDLVTAWLTHSNAHLRGRVPVEVFRLEGAAPLLIALRAEAAGAYA